MKRTTPFQCFRKPAREAAAASGDTLQTDDRNVNIKIYSKWTRKLILSYAVQKTRPMLTLAGTW